LLRAERYIGGYTLQLNVESIILNKEIK
jgi:hypothetical protein